jgi:hypothetical protein
MSDKGSAKIHKIQDTVTAKLQEIVDRGSSFEQWVTRVGTKKLIVKINDMFKDQGPGWTKTDSTYYKTKEKRFSKYDGGGKFISIATDNLRKGMTAQNKDFRQVITSDGWVVTTGTPYAKYVDEKNSLTKFSEDPEFKKDMKDSMSEYLRRGRL